jgi:geranylgeranyl diphosphate synthase type II
MGRYTRGVDAGGILAEVKSLVDSRLDELLPGESVEPTPLHQAMRYACLPGGKRLRPALCLASAEAVGGSRLDALDAACALEMIHTFSLVHDDLPALDDDTLRRGRPSCHVQFGEALAILAGDALFALAFRTLAACSDEAPICAEAVLTAAEASGSAGLVGGEVLDVLSEGKEVGAEGVRMIHERKTAALIAASCKLGGLLGGGSEGQTRALFDFGRTLGLAFQIADDVLNETSTADVLGKAAGSDRSRDKATFPSVLGVQQSQERARQEVEAALAILSSRDLDSEKLKVLANHCVKRAS